MGGVEDEMAQNHRWSWFVCLKSDSLVGRVACSQKQQVTGADKLLFTSKVSCCTDTGRQILQGTSKML